MRKKKIATKHFGGVIDITDPCYNKDVWCRMNAIVKEGNYDCCIWIDEEENEFNGRKFISKTVGAIGIYLDGIIPPQSSMSEIGEIGVDAGLAGFFMDKPDYSDEAWSDFCDSIKDGDAWIKDEGFFSSSGNGDGSYPVFEFRNKKDEIIALEIRFM